MESTGVYWKPVYHLLEGHFEVWVVNAQHLHRVPRRKKTDKVDAEWIAQCLRHGLLSPSFVPPRPQRDLRDLTRERAKLRNKRDELPAALTGNVREHHRFLLTEHLQHLEFLEQQIARFNDQIATQIDRMSPPPGSVSPTPAGKPRAAAAADEPHPRPVPPLPLSYEAAISFLDPIPGIDREGAEAILAELGTDMSQFPSAAHAASGRCAYGSRCTTVG